jgi:hypothetical protein
MTEVVNWLLGCAEPWTRFRTLVDLLDVPADDLQVQEARVEMFAHPQVQALIDGAATWPGYPITRHNDSKHPIYQFSTLADFGACASDPGIAPIVEALMAHQSPEGAFQSQVSIPEAFGGTGQENWTWVLCDAPTLLYALLAMGIEAEGCVRIAVQHLIGLAQENGWGCAAAPELGRFRGPGRKGDPCPIANVYTLKALALVPEARDCPATCAGIEMLLRHWEMQKEKKYYLFGIGGDFRKLKYPFVWYDILHVVDVLSRFPFVYDDRRFLEMTQTVFEQADPDGRFTASSMYQSWKGWSFADKKHPSPWLTFLALRIQKRLGS